MRLEGFFLPSRPRLVLNDIFDEALRKLRAGPGVELAQADDSTFVNPAGDPRPFVDALFRRNS